VLDDYESALESISDFRGKPAGTLRLTVAPPAADFVLAPVMARFLALYPEITLDISVDATLTDIVAGRFDAGIRPGERLERDMIAVRVSDQIETVVVAAPHYLAKRGVPKVPHDLVAHNCVRIRLPSGALFPWRFRVSRRNIEMRVEGTLIVNETALALRAASDGVGVVQTAKAYAEPEIRARRLVTLLADSAPPPIDGFFLYYPSRRQTRAAHTALVDFLRDVRRRTSNIR
jgi:DNA-binding transcriptional LysR family regulator